MATSGGRPRGRRRRGARLVVGGSPGIRLTRAHRNRDPRSRAFGIGTSHSYDLFLVSDRAELVLAYGDFRLPSFGRMWLAQTMEYTYDERHQMLAVREPGMSLDHEYDAAERVIRQQVAGWGTWTFTDIFADRGPRTST